MRRSHDFGTEFSGERYLTVRHRSQSFQQDQARANFVSKSRLCNKNNILENVACPWQSAFLPDYKYFTYFYAQVSWSESRVYFYRRNLPITRRHLLPVDFVFLGRKTVLEKIRSYRIWG